MQEIEALMMNCPNESERMMLKFLMDRDYRQREEFFRNR